MGWHGWVAKIHVLRCEGDGAGQIMNYCENIEKQSRDDANRKAYKLLMQIN